jgi:uncharacterized protein (DUF1800 family)
MALRTEREKTAHLLRRFGLGASEAELNYYGQDGHGGAIELLLRDDQAPADPVVDFEALRNPKNGRLPMGAAVNAWTARLVCTQRPLREKMTLFWHDHFATSAGKVKSAELMLAQNETIRANALGKFLDLLTAVSKDPAMLIWLDNQENVAGRPNENFAREVMELFTLGIGHYSEADVREGARAFTGWSVRRVASEGEKKSTRAEFLLRNNRHDTGKKRFLNHEAVESGEEVLRILASSPITYEHLSKKLWEWFAYPDPGAEIIRRLTTIFHDTDGDIAQVLRSIMTSAEFYSAKAERAVVKNPVDFVVTTLRQIGFGPVVSQRITGTPRVALAMVANAARSMKKMGMWLYYPPDVAGWDGGQAWITTATMVERMSWASGLFPEKSRVGLTVLTPGMTAKERIETLCSVLDVRLAPDRASLLTGAAEKLGPVTEANSIGQSAAICRLIFAMPEFQFA